MDLAYNVALVPITTALVQVVKKIGLPDKFAPILSVVFGLGLSYLINGGAIFTWVLGGVLVGLSASGLYDHVKK